MISDGINIIEYVCSSKKKYYGVAYNKLSKEYISSRRNYIHRVCVFVKYNRSSKKYTEKKNEKTVNWLLHWRIQLNWMLMRIANARLFFVCNEKCKLALSFMSTLTLPLTLCISKAKRRAYLKVCVCVCVCERSIATKLNVVFTWKCVCVGVCERSIATQLSVVFTW